MNSTLRKGLSLVNRNSYGDILEFGVYKGSTITAIRGSIGPDYKVYGFDSFEGLPEDWQDTQCTKGFFSTNKQVPNITGVIFFAGWFENTLKEYVKISNNIKFIHMDCDLYSSTKTVLDNIGKLILPGTVIVFDEWRFTNTEGKLVNGDEKRAFEEWTLINNRTYTEYGVNENIEQKLIIIEK
jgi:hypothetical protein